MLPKSADILVIGGGVVGASVAYHLAAAGVKGVVLVEREPFLGMGATAKASGGVRYQFSTAVNIDLSVQSLQDLARFEDLFGVSCDYRPIGYLFMLTQPEQIPLFRASLELQHARGVPWTRWLTPTEVRDLVPLLRTDDVLGATWCPQDGVADPNTITTTYAQAAARLGARLELETTVLGFETRSGRVAAVVTDRGRIQTPCVVNCAGPWAGELGKLAGLDIPVQPLRRQSHLTGPLREFPRDHPFAIDFASSLYFRPEGGGVHFGMSNAAETPGFKTGIDEAFREVTLTRAVERLPLLEKASVAYELVGWYEDTPDHHPILSGVRDLPGYYIAAGFSGHGMMHAPAAGKVMSELIQQGRATTVDISGLDLERFAEGRAIPEVNVI